jgi:hypothetical protein
LSVSALKLARSGNGTIAGHSRARIGRIASSDCSAIGRTTAACSTATKATMASANSAGRSSAFGTVTVRVANRDPPAIDARDDDVTIHR